MSKHATIVLAEDLRAEIGGRFSIIGSLVGELRIITQHTKTPPSINLAVYAEVEGIKNPKKILVRIISPSGSIITEGRMPPPGHDTIVNGFVVGGRFQNLIIESEGQHKISVIVDDKEFNKFLEISFQKA